MNDEFAQKVLTTVLLAEPDSSTEKDICRSKLPKEKTDTEAEGRPKPKEDKKPKQFSLYPKSILTNQTLHDPFCLFEYPISDDVITCHPQWARSDDSWLKRIPEIKCEHLSKNCFEKFLLIDATLKKYKTRGLKKSRGVQVKLAGKDAKDKSCQVCPVQQENAELAYLKHPDKVKRKQTEPVITKLRIPEICKKELKVSIYQIGQHMKKLEANELLQSDIELIVDHHKVYRAHKIMLMTFSHWFYKTIKDLGFATPYIILNDVNADTFGLLYRYMYTQKLPLKISNVTSVAALAKRLEMPFALRRIQKFISLQIQAQGPVTMIKQAEKIASEFLLNAIANYLTVNFDRLVSRDEFLLYSIDDAWLILSLKYLPVSKQKLVFEAGVRWLVYDWFRRERYVKQILCCVQVKKLSDDDILSCIVAARNLDLTKTAECRDIVVEAFMGLIEKRLTSIDDICLSHPLSSSLPPEISDYFLVPDNLDEDLDPYIMKKVVFIQRYFLDLKAYEPDQDYTGPPVSLNKFDEFEKQKIAATKIQAAVRSYLARKRLKDQEVKAVEEKIIPTVSPPLSEVAEAGLKAEPQKIERIEPLVKVKKLLLLLGGFDPSVTQQDPEAGKTVFCYKCDESPWGIFDNLPKPCHNFAAAWLHGTLYITGGSKNTTPDAELMEASSHTWCYDPLMKLWSVKSRMINARMYHALVSFNGLLFAISGLGKDQILIATIESYNPAQDQWSESASLLTPRMGHSAIVLQEKILICGGISQHPVQGSLLLNICEYFDPQRKSVSSAPSLSFPRCFVNLINYEGKILLLGGATVRGEEADMKVKSLRDVDVWNPILNCWQPHSELQVARHNAAAAVKDNTIYIIGGQSSQLNCVLRSVEYFNIKKEWKIDDELLPKGITGGVAVVVEQVGTT